MDISNSEVFSKISEYQPTEINKVQCEVNSPILFMLDQIKWTIRLYN